MYLIFSTSLHPNSRSRILARCAAESFERARLEWALVDLAEMTLPDCDGAECYGHHDVQQLADRIASSDAILIASPVYNYDLSASAKRLIELTGSAWKDKVVGFLAAAGGSGSYMSVMGLANSLMLDFRTLIVPRFVYATETSFCDGEIIDSALRDRIDELATQIHRISSALRG